MELVSSATLAPSTVAFIQQALTSLPGIHQHMVAILATEAILDIDSQAMDLPLVVRSSICGAALLSLLVFGIRWLSIGQSNHAWFFGWELHGSHEINFGSGKGRWELSFGVICPMLWVGIVNALFSVYTVSFICGFLPFLLPLRSIRAIGEISEYHAGHGDFGLRWDSSIALYILCLSSLHEFYLIHPNFFLRFQTPMI